jgi:signal transduction histidine kinase
MKIDERERESQYNWNTLSGIADSLLLLVDNLIDSAKISVDPKSLNQVLTAHPSPCDMEVVVQRVVEAFNAQMLCRSVHITPSLDIRLCGTGACLVDKARVGQFLSNILQELVRSDA